MKAVISLMMIALLGIGTISVAVISPVAIDASMGDNIYPNDALYGVEKMGEAIRLAANNIDHIDLAGERLAEADYLKIKRPTDPIIKELKEEAIAHTTRVTSVSSARTRQYEEIIKKIIEDPPQEIAGDADCDGDIDLADIIFLISYLDGGPAGECGTEVMDVNGNCVIDSSDVKYLIEYYRGIGPAPILPENCDESSEIANPVDKMLEKSKQMCITCNYDG